MPSHRVARVEKNVQQTLAGLLTREYRAGMKGLVTVSHVSMPADLRSARVIISVLGSADDEERTMDYLELYAKEIQGVLGRQLKMKFSPRISFVLDRTGEETARVFRTLNEIKDENSSEDS